MRHDRNENETEGIRYEPGVLPNVLHRVRCNIHYHILKLRHSIITACKLSSLYTFPTAQATQNTSTAVGSLTDSAYITGSTQ